MTAPHELDDDAAAALDGYGMDAAEALAALAEHARAGRTTVTLAAPAGAPWRLHAPTATGPMVAREVTLHARTWLNPDRTLRAVRWSTRDRVTRLDREVWRTWTAPAVVRLLRVVTGDDRHLEEPVAWLCGQTGCDAVWSYRDSVELELCLRAPDGQPAGWARWMFAETAADLWEAWLGERGWTFAGGRYCWTSPSGHEYSWGLAHREEPSETLVVACAREGVDLRAELDASARVLARLLGFPAEISAVPAAALPLLTRAARRA